MEKKFVKSFVSVSPECCVGEEEKEKKEERELGEGKWWVFITGR